MSKNQTTLKIDKEINASYTKISEVTGKPKSVLTEQYVKALIQLVCMFKSCNLRFETSVLAKSLTIYAEGDSDLIFGTEKHVRDTIRKRVKGD